MPSSGCGLGRLPGYLSGCVLIETAVKNLGAFAFRYVYRKSMTSYEWDV
jgi:hypothetical protein